MDIFCQWYGSTTFQLYAVTKHSLQLQHAFFIKLSASIDTLAAVLSVTLYHYFQKIGQSVMGKKF